MIKEQLKRKRLDNPLFRGLFHLLSRIEETKEENRWEKAEDLTTATTTREGKEYTTTIIAKANLKSPYKTNGSRGVYA